MHGTRMSEDIADRFLERFLPDLEKAKKAGKIGHICVTGHQAPTAMVKLIETGKVDMLQFPINPFWREFLEVVLPVAKKRDVGIVAMKPTSRGKLLSSSPGVDAIIGPTKEEKLVNLFGFGLAQDIASVSIGFLHEPHIKEDIGAALSFLGRPAKGFSEEEAKRLALKAHETVKDNCRVCNRCLPCPVRIDVPRVLRLQLYARHYGFTEWAKQEYRRLRTKPDECTKCGECTEKCPYGVPAQELVLRAAKELA
jgi:predicted aldo/keto reductase-like oxidoreductase